MLEKLLTGLELKGNKRAFQYKPGSSSQKAAASFSVPNAHTKMFFSNKVQNV